MAMASQFYDNDELQRYFEAEVVPRKEETKLVTSALKPDLDELFQFIKDYNSSLYQQVAYVGSFYQGLKVRRSDEFDYTLCMDINADRVECRRDDPVLYGFKGYDSKKDRLAHTVPQVKYGLLLLFYIYFIHVNYSTRFLYKSWNRFQ